MDIDKSAGAEIIYRYAKEPVETFADNMYEAEKMKAATVCRTEEERQAVIDAETVKFSLLLNGTAIQLTESQNEEEHMVNLIDEGKPAPETKGPGGTRIGIDGKPEPAQSHSKGYVLTDYGWQATHFKEDTFTQLRTTMPDIISGTIPDAKNELIEKTIKPAAIQATHFGGDS